MDGSPLCMFCGGNESLGAMDREHFVPKCLWSGPRPDKTFVMPVHVACNRKYSDDSEYFRDVLVAQEGIQRHPAAGRGTTTARLRDTARPTAKMPAARTRGCPVIAAREFGAHFQGSNACLARPIVRRCPRRREQRHHLPGRQQLVQQPADEGRAVVALEHQRGAMPGEEELKRGGRRFGRLVQHRQPGELHAAGQVAHCQHAPVVAVDRRRPKEPPFGAA